ncbi:hypothetical protein QTP86_015385 [Hemibagrus guttatus]|nr:hypothetical protein QTP86_015385 [Hemibagrus guttatus]
MGFEERRIKMGFFEFAKVMMVVYNLLILFFSIIAIILISELTIGILALAYSSHLGKLLKSWARPVLQYRYGRDLHVTSQWNMTMTKLQCCGFNNYTDFVGSYYSKLYGEIYHSSCCGNTTIICDMQSAHNSTVQGAGGNWATVGRRSIKYFGSTVQSNGECGKEVKKRVQAGWNGWRKVSGVLCDRKISARIKGKVYRTVVRPAMLYGLETVSLRKRQESELEVAELKMLRFSLGVTRLDRIKNEYFRGTVHVGRLRDKVREARLRWFGHVQRRESEYIGRRMLDMELPGRRQRGRPKRRYMDGINEDMKLVGPNVEDAEDRDKWREMIRCGDP